MPGSTVDVLIVGAGPVGLTMAAALNHSAFNIANALGPWLGGMAIAAGFGLSSTGYVGCGLALGGLLVWAIALAVGRAQARSIARF